MTPTEAIRQALKTGWSQELEDVIVAYGNPYRATDFAEHIDGANIDRLQQVVINYGNPELAYDFAVYVEGANISDLIDFVIIKDPVYLKNLFQGHPDLKRKYELGEIRSVVRKALNIK